MANLGRFGRSWAKIGGTPALPIGLKIPTYMSRNSFHAVPTVPDLQSPKSQILAVFGPFGPIFGQFWTLEVSKLKNKAGTPWNEVQDTQTDEK